MAQTPDIDLGGVLRVVAQGVEVLHAISQFDPPNISPWQILAAAVFKTSPLDIPDNPTPGTMADHVKRALNPTIHLLLANLGLEALARMHVDLAHGKGTDAEIAWALAIQLHVEDPERDPLYAQTFWSLVSSFTPSDPDEGAPYPF